MMSWENPEKWRLLVDFERRHKKVLGKERPSTKMNVTLKFKEVMYRYRVGILNVGQGFYRSKVKSSCRCDYSRAPSGESYN